MTKTPYMKRHILCILCLVALLLTFSAGWAQTGLAPDQNPNYAISRARYTGMADSINEWHSTTVDNTYKAIDWMQDRADARADRRSFRRELRYQRAVYGYGYGDYGYNNYGYDAYPNNYSSYRNYNQGYYRNYNRGYYQRNSFYVNPWGAGYRWR